MRAAVVFLLLAGCGGSAKDARYPARPEGCDVKVFAEAPDAPTDNLGPVRASCGEDISSADCLRTLEDQVCRLGGDVVWGVPAEPAKADGKIRWSGRAAHTRVKSALPEGGSL